MQIEHLYRQLDERGGMLYAWFPAMHSRVDLLLCHKPETVLRSVALKVHEELKRLEGMASYYNSGSELYRVNESAADAPVAVTPELFSMIGVCLDYNVKTSGCFDITVQSGNYDRDTVSAVELSAGDSTVFFGRPGTRIDLSGFLKGYALEKIRDILKEEELENALVNMGNSSVLALGDHPFGKGWKVGFLNFSTEDILLCNECLTTSGNDTALRSHIISPYDGELIGGEGAVAVVTDDGVSGEILSTGLFAAPPSLRGEIAGRFRTRRVYGL